jgi:monothiol glutaredoxin
MTLDPALRARIDETLSQHRVVLFMKGNKTFPQCGFSATVVKILKDVGVPFETVNVLTDPEIRDGIKAYSDWATIPQLYVDKTFVGGCDIVRDLFERGELGPVLGVDGKTPAAKAPPKLVVSDTAAKAFTGVEIDAGDVLRYTIGPRFQNELFFGPKEAGDVIVTANGVAFHLDTASAARADGVSIDFVEGNEGGFKIDNPNAPPSVKPLSARELSAMLTKKEDFVLVDVRTRGEWDTARIPGARFLDDGLLGELDAGPKDRKLVFQCHHGVRSQAAAERFLNGGFSNVWNLEGGIDAYSDVDSTVPRY